MLHYIYDVFVKCDGSDTLFCCDANVACRENNNSDTILLLSEVRVSGMYGSPLCTTSIVLTYSLLDLWALLQDGLTQFVAQFSVADSTT